MLGTIEQPRDEVSEYAPRLDRVQIPSEKIGVLIGPGGRQIKAIQEDTGANIEVNDDGVVLVSGDSGEIVAKAMSLVRAVTAEIEVGQVFDWQDCFDQGLWRFRGGCPRTGGPLPCVGA